MELASLFYKDILTAPVHVYGGGRTLIHLERDWHGIPDLLGWLQGYNTAEAFYFKEKYGDYVRAGLGSAHIFQGLPAQEIITAVNSLGRVHPDIFVCGGCGFFDEAEQAHEWQDFGRFHFMLPRVAVRQSHGSTRIAVNHCASADRSPDHSRRQLLAELQQLDADRIEPGQLQCSVPQIEVHDRIPSRDQWVRIINQALAQIEHGHISKVVLARKEILRASRNWNARALLAQLEFIEEDSFLFLYQIGHYQAFLGRSPERLFCIRNQMVTSEAIAGTRPRGAHPISDQLFTDELLGSAKEMEEHRIVARYIQQHIQAHCRRVKAQVLEKPFKLKNLQHILTRFAGELKNGCHPLELLLSLHPTPAVGGHPTLAALDLIRRLEPFGRGWYAAPVGWMNSKTADFAVGIRSALVQGSDLHLYAGTGIVDRSEPVSEWRETESKLRNFYAVTGIDR